MSSNNVKSELPTMPLQKEGKTPNIGTNAPMRLSSFSLPRDLTLGGAGQGLRGASSNKKVYTPNLNVVRNKNTNVKTSKDTSARGRGRSERGTADRGRGRGRGGTFIQTSGVFSEGAGAAFSRKHFSGGSGGSRTNDESASSMRKPTLIKKEINAVETEAEREKFLEIVGESDDDDFSDQKIDPAWTPIILRGAKKIEKEEQLVKIKTEPISDNTEGIVNEIKEMTMNSSAPASSITLPPQSMEELLSKDELQFMMIQLPDALPCVDPDDSTEDTPTNHKESTSTTETKPKERVNPLMSMEEGRIGKLIRYKSGKTKLVLGDMWFDLSMGIESTYLQELMSICTNREERSGKMINLGTVLGKISIAPDWEYMLNKN